VTFDDLDMPFPLWKAPVANAVAERDAPCRHCRKQSAFVFRGACYACLRADKCSAVVGTEFGMVRREDAERGLTHGIPAGLIDLAGYEVVEHPIDPQFPEEAWVSVRIDREELLELLRTPSFHSWQDDTWLFCCKKPCIFLGDLPDDLRSEEHIAELFVSEDSEELLARIERGSVCTYAFRCRVCHRVRAYYDMD
jgi:uncharacterized protein CbrC (UPF0167 family)